MTFQGREKKKKWVRGKEMPLFSGKKWIELEDIWPAEQRVKDDAYMILGLFYPAWEKTKKFIRATYNEKYITSEDFFLLCWLHRVEEGRENVAFFSYPTTKYLYLTQSLWNTRKSRITKLGFIENLIANNITKSEGGLRVYRVTEKGKIVIKKFIEYANEAKDELAINLANNPHHEKNDAILRRTYSFFEYPKKEAGELPPSPESNPKPS